MASAPEEDEAGAKVFSTRQGCPVKSSAMTENRRVSGDSFIVVRRNGWDNFLVTFLRPKKPPARHGETRAEKRRANDRSGAIHLSNSEGGMRFAHSILRAIRVLPIQEEPFKFSFARSTPTSRWIG